MTTPTSRVVPCEPTEKMWDGLARDLVMWSRTRGCGDELYALLRGLGREVPDWLVKEIPDTHHVPPKGTVAACIYKAMVEKAPIPTLPADAGEVVERLRKRLIIVFRPPTGTGSSGGYHEDMPDPLCVEAADIIERLLGKPQND